MALRGSLAPPRGLGVLGCSERSREGGPERGAFLALETRLGGKGRPWRSG
jgi:hypothetical protein